MSKVETLGAALEGAVHGWEPDVASAVRGGVERGRRRRRNRRIAQVAGSTAGIVAVGAVSVLITDASPRQHAVTPTPGSTATTGSPAVTAPKYAFGASSDKVLDIRMHLPGLLQQIVPSGASVAAAPKEWTSFGGAAFSVSDTSGAAQIQVTSGPVDDDAQRGAARFCPGAGSTPLKHCEQRRVSGGTLFFLSADKTAADDLGGADPAGLLQPGHGNDVVWKGLLMTFAPDDRSKPYFQIDEQTQVEAMPYASTPPKGSKTYQWPPTDNDVKGATGTRLTISAQDFAAMVGTPQLGQLQHLLDPSVPASQSAIDERNAVNAQLARLAGPVLPAGVKLTVDYSEAGHGLLVLTGPTGVNGLQWYTDKRSHGLLATNNLKCPPEQAHCVTKKVPGATVQWSDGFEDPQPGFGTFEYVPDDAAGKEVGIILSPINSATGPDPSAPKTTAQLTYDQMLAVVTDPHIAAITQDTTLLGK